MSEQINFGDLKRTMPWQEVVYPNGQVMILDNQGREVPLFTMTAFLTFITAKLTTGQQTATQQASAG